MNTIEQTASPRSEAEVIERYRSRGYDVVRDVEGARVIGEAKRDFIPDLVATRGDEVVIIEIKRGGERTDPRTVERLNTLLKQHSNWRLDLVYLPEPRDQEDWVVSLDRAKQAIAESDRLRDEGHAAAALLQLWSAVEAIAWRRLKEIEPELKARDMVDWAKLLVHYGVVEQDDYRRLRDVREKRSRIAHGGLDIDITLADFAVLQRIGIQLLSIDAATTED
jgi:Holliday junction resolvase